MKCESCSFKTVDWTSFNKHLGTHASELTTTREKRNHKCSHCNYTSLDKFRYTLHMKKHQPINIEGKKKCKICDYWTRFENHLRRHMAYHNVDGNVANTELSTR